MEENLTGIFRLKGKEFFDIGFFSGSYLYGFLIC